MEHAPLRPVPDRPTEAVSEPEAVARVAAELPQLGERERVALALAALAGTPRPQVAARLGIGAAELAEVLAAGRKGLRRTLSPLPGSGWCERAERLISDRIDDALAEADAPRLNAHQRNCPRCVEHERKLVQATDSLMAGVAPQPSPPVVAEPPAADDGPPAPILVRVPERASAPEPEASPARRTGGQLVSALGWSALIVFAVLLALAALGLALAGALGAQL